MAQLTHRGQVATYATAAERWAGVGPYYAMFPTAFSNAVVDSFTAPGDVVLDPFAGRASSIFSAATSGRTGFGVEINPVGWIYGQTKLHPAQKASVERRLRAMVALAEAQRSSPPLKLPRFFRRCFHRETLGFLQIARAELDWRSSRVDRTLMALILVYLHGKRGDSLSNQMRQSKAMSPQYSIAWWEERAMQPPYINVHEFLKRRIDWRYARGLPAVTPSTVVLGDSRRILNLAGSDLRPARLLFTSPPYSGVTSYHYDQWLRLWLLGYSDSPRRTGEFHVGKFESLERYTVLLRDVFKKCAELMDDAGHVYVRTDARKRTRTVTRDVLRDVFPDWTMRVAMKPLPRTSQTALFGDHSSKPGEVDVILRGPKAGRRVFRVHRR